VEGDARFDQPRLTCHDDLVPGKTGDSQMKRPSVPISTKASALLRDVRGLLTLRRL
jgi:hypothetical protein